MTQQEPQTLVALFGTLADATAALHALQDAGVPYANISMDTHTSSELHGSLGAATLPDQVWSLAVLIGEPLHTKALDVLREQHAFALGQQTPPLDGRDEIDRGRTAWGHYVFEPVDSSHWVGDAAGTAGTTGIISSGAFADNAHAEDKPAKQNVPDQARG